MNVARSFDWLRRLTDRQFTVFAAVLVMALIYALSAPALWLIASGEYRGRFPEYLILSEHLWWAPPGSLGELDILRYRMLFPLLGFASPGTGIIGHILPYLCSFLAIGVVARFLIVRLDRVDILPILFLTFSTGAFIWGYSHPGHSDSGAVLMIALCMTLARRWLIPLAVVLGAMADERLIFAIPSIIVFRMVTNPNFDSADRITFRNMLGEAIPFATGVAGVLLYRVMVESGAIGVGVPETYQSSDFLNGLMLSPKESWGSWLAGTFFGLRWCLLALCLAPFVLEGNIARIAFVVGAIVPIYASLGFGDVARGVGYAFPAVLTGLILFSREMQGILSRRVIAVLCGLTVLTPVYGNWPHDLMYPLPLVIARMMVG